jgi:hypothetical protein
MINEKFILSKANLPKDLVGQTKIVCETDFRNFGGKYRGSRKQPDLAILLRRADRCYDIKFILEAGLSECYEDLVEDAKLWLEGTRQVSMVGLIYQVSCHNLY